MFAARPATEIVARDQNRRALEIGTVEQIVGIGAQAFERAAPHALARRRLQPVRGDDHVGIDILEPERNRAAFDLVERGHAIHSRTRSEARRVGNECVSTCRSRWSPYIKKKKATNTSTLIEVN